MSSSTRSRPRRPEQAPPAWVHPRCDCGKVYAADLADAKKWRRLYAEHNGNHNECRYYRCEYGTWHWSSRLDWKEAS